MSNFWLKSIALAGVLLLLPQCKEKKAVKEELKVERVSQVPIPKVISDLAIFGGLSISDPEELRTVLLYRMVDSSGSIQEIDMASASKICKQLMTGKKSRSYPIVEIKNSSRVILMAQGRGYGGPIWGKLLLDTSKMEFEKLEFQHSAESEGYGAAMTQSNFETQFTGASLTSGPFVYGLEMNNKSIISGAHPIEGISGATETSRSAVNMINKCLENYWPYITSFQDSKKINL